ncbi:MAG: hypothetical protein IBJ11_11260, partial [Phycisphaerales bacterium]|nr:hypothetical protein [Phycisphaerales bacterium]
GVVGGGADPDGAPERYEQPASPTPPRVSVPAVMHEILEETVRLARRSPHINQASGVSVRASIALLETLVSAAEMRGLRTGEAAVTPRVCDMSHLGSALRGKIELMISEDSPDGSATEDKLIDALLGEGLKSVIGRYAKPDALEPVAEAFGGGLKLELDNATSAADAAETIKAVNELNNAAVQLCRRLEMDPADPQQRACAGELVLEFLYVHNRLSKSSGRGRASYRR